MDDTCCCCNHKHPVKFFRTNSWQQAAMSSHDTGRFNHRTQRYISGSYDVGPECFPIFHGLSCILNPPPYFMGWCFHRKHVMRTSYIPSWPNHWWTCHHRAFVINKTPNRHALSTLSLPTTTKTTGCQNHPLKICLDMPGRRRTHFQACGNQHIDAAAIARTLCYSTRLRDNHVSAPTRVQQFH